MSNRTAPVAASCNTHKIKEIAAALAPFGMGILTYKEAGIESFAPEENGESFEENSLIKARALHELIGGYVIADDSGLEVDALGGAPGIYSARFAGDDEKNNERLLKLLKYVADDERTARFVCVITMIDPDGKVLQTRGECSGRIAGKASGTGGFGYDPLFIPDEYADEGYSFADITQEQKNTISHRAMALKKLSEELARV